MPDEEVEADVTATPVDEVPTDFREYVQWRKAGGNTATGPAAEAGVEPPNAGTAPVPEPEQPPEPEEPAPDDDEEPAPAATRPGRKERIIERQAREIEELKQQLATQKPPEKPAESKPAEGKPRLHDFETLEAYQEALTDWKIDQRERERRETDARNQAIAAQTQVEDQWKSKQSDVRKLYPDYDEAIQSAQMPATPNEGVIRQALLEDPHGPEVCYWLAKHPDEVKRIAGLSPIGAVRELGRISAMFDDSGNGNQKPKISSAPKPPPAMTRPSRTGSDSILDENVARDFKKWNRAREAQLKER